MLPPSRGRVIFCDSREEGSHGVIHRRSVATPPTLWDSMDLPKHVPDLTSKERQKKSSRSHRHPGLPSASPTQNSTPMTPSVGVCTPSRLTPDRRPTPDLYRRAPVQDARTPDRAASTPDSTRANSRLADSLHTRRLGSTPDGLRSHLDPLANEKKHLEPFVAGAPELKTNAGTPHSHSSAEFDKFTRTTAASDDHRTKSTSSCAFPSSNPLPSLPDTQVGREIPIRYSPCLDLSESPAAKPIGRWPIELTPSSGGTPIHELLSPEHEMLRHLSGSPSNSRHARRRPLDLRHWKQGELLGQGSSGEVYKAMCGGQFLAVKKIKLQVGSNAASRKEAENLRTEIELLNRLDHPRIVRYAGCLLEEDCGSHNVLIFLEYMPSGSLSSVMKKFGPYGTQLVKKYTRQILEGLAFLHSKGIVHRDVKGANVLVDHLGEAKLADFGACKQLEVLHSTLTGGLSEVKGSVFWMAPETATGTSGRRCDIWSAGCVVIEMLTARPPWTLHRNVKNWSLLQALQHIIESNEIPPIPENCDPKCHDFLLECLVREHRKRPYAHKLLNHEFLL